MLKRINLARLFVFCVMFSAALLMLQFMPTGGSINIESVQAADETDVIVAKNPPRSDYFIVTGPDPRDCLYPMCGGYFVKRVNAEVTQCADGTWQEECHMAKLNLSRLGLSKEQVRKFKRLFFNGYALVRGKMKAIDKGYDVPVDTLIASEAWAGVVSTEEPKGHFSRVDDTGIVCITYPCPYFIERSLNTNLTDSLGEVDLAASGASEKQVELGMAELERSGLLIVGTHDILSGPAGTMNSLIASEFYSRVLPITSDEP